MTAELIGASWRCVSAAALPVRWRAADASRHRQRRRHRDGDLAAAESEPIPSSRLPTSSTSRSRISGRFEPEQRDQGLLAIGARTENITDSGLEAYDEIARGVAAQVVDARHRAALIGCKPRSETSAR